MDKDMQMLLDLARGLKEKTNALEDHARQVLYVEVSRIRDEVNALNSRVKDFVDLVEHMAGTKP